MSSLLSLSGQADPRDYVLKDWTSKKLGEICTIFGGGRLGLTKEKDYQSSGVQAFSAAGPDGFVEVVEIVDGDGVILSAIGAHCGKCFFATGTWTTLANVRAIIPDVTLNAKYLFYYVNREGYWEKSGSAQPFVKPSSVKSSWVVYPPSTFEQARIAEVLSTVDRAIEQTEALIAKQERIKTGLMQDLLTRGIDEHGNLRSESTHQFKDSALGRIPVEWEPTTIDSLAAFVTSGSRGWAKFYAVEGDRFLRIGDLTRNHINFRHDDIAYVCPPASSEGKRTAVETGDVLISITADLGIIGVVPEGFGTAYVNQHIALVRIKPEAANPRFIGWYLSSIGGQRQFVEVNESGAKAGLNLPTIRKMRLPIHRDSVRGRVEQDRIVSYLDQATENVEKAIKTRDKLVHLKTGLMQDLLTGKKRVTPLLELAEAH